MSFIENKKLSTKDKRKLKEIEEFLRKNGKNEAEILLILGEIKMSHNRGIQKLDEILTKIKRVENDIT
jgi:hypothetical protein